MKLFFTGFLLMFLSFSALAQNNFILNQKVPQAGEFIENTPSSPEQNKYSKGELGYDSLGMSFQGNWPLGSANNIISSITGDTVFIASGGGVIILDITNPETPQVISEVYARAYVDHLHYDYASQQLYLAAYFSGFEIWDLADITNPSRLSRTPTDALPRGGIYSYQDHLYIITVSGGLLVYDISDPANPNYVTTTSISGSAWNFYGKDNFLYIQTNNAMRLYDLSSPSAPILRDSYGGSPKGIYVKDDLCYIAESSALVITDVSNPDDIVFVGNLAIPGSAYDVVVIDGFAYVANNWYGGSEGGIYAIDVNDPANPIQADFYNSYFRAISGEDSKVVAINNEGYCVFDVSTPGQLDISTIEGLPGSLTDVALKGDYAFTGSNGFRVFDVNDISKPQQVAFLDIIGSALDISGDILAYIPESMGAGNRLSIMDISDPENPNEMGYYNNISLSQDAIIQGDYVYVGGWWDGFTVFDISDPTNPSFVTKEHNWSSSALPGEEWCYVSDLAVYGNYLYLIDYKPFEDDDTKGLYTFDISDPENPVLISRYKQQSQQSWRIKAHSNYVYLADAYGGIEIIDVSNPETPITVAYQELIDVAYNLDLANGYAYASCYINGGVQAVDVSDPENPFLEGFYQKSGLFALNVTANDHDIYIADGGSGFQIYGHDAVHTAIEESILYAETIAAFPNPSQGILQVQMEGASELVIFDQTAKAVRKTTLEEGVNTLDLSDLPNGVYFLKFKLEDHISLRKIVISR
ncbi:MAG: hypothetical protein B7C24_08390 [Bacteroidetes bacterium 4572_77]|nr:MAG: hypothetical protein B7C24_08390 [Bacteroidetes bacterium 4572_77]